MIIPHTKRHPNNLKTDQLPVLRAITNASYLDITDEHNNYLRFKLLFARSIAFFFSRKVYSMLLTYIICNYWCVTFVPFQLAPPPGFHVAHIPKGNLAYIYHFLCVNWSSIHGHICCMVSGVEHRVVLGQRVSRSSGIAYSTTQTVMGERYVYEPRYAGMVHSWIMW